jgi:hypothetical protein
MAWMEATEWEPDLSFLGQLGGEGWELVAIVPRSGVLGGEGSEDSTLDYAGFTNQELWVFKRPMI